MKKPNFALPNLKPIPPPPPLYRRAIDFTTVQGTNVLVAVGYSTNWVEISDNAGCFKGAAAQQWHKQHGSEAKSVTPIRPRGNGKVEKANGDIKHAIVRKHMENLEQCLQELVFRARRLHSRTVGTSGYSPFFLMFGTQPPELTNSAQFSDAASYVREPTEEEDIEFTISLAEGHEAPIARARESSLRASQDKVRAYLQEKKALLRIYAPGDWVLRVGQRKHKHEPFYDRPWQVVECHANNTYSIKSPGGLRLELRYNGTNLFPAYVDDHQPVQNLSYASKTQLERDRRRLREAVNIRKT
ncbi:hypothetical protein K3495_g3299 [Podosphaera aphanis]|nr:hypothetical protein K3495_g3299 [Podosphaera aphanis]